MNDKVQLNLAFSQFNNLFLFLTEHTKTMLRRILSQSPHILALNRLKCVANASTSSSMNNEILIITERAAKQLQNIAAPDEHLRVCVDSGGCSGFEYKMELSKEINENEDEVVRVAKGATVVIDKTSIEFLRGSKLDYVEDLMRASFRITENPKATSGCSCGTSFAPKNMME